MEEIYYKALAHTVIELAGPDLECELEAWRLRRADGAHEVKGSLLENSFSLEKPSTDWTRPTHSMEGNLLYSKFRDLNVNLIQKHS